MTYEWPIKRALSETLKDRISTFVWIFKDTPKIICTIDKNNARNMVIGLRSVLTCSDLQTAEEEFNKFDRLYDISHAEII